MHRPCPDRPLTKKEQNMVDQTVASLNIEQFYPSKEVMDVFAAIASGKITDDEAVSYFKKEADYE